MKYGDFSQILSGINILGFFSKLELVLAMSELFHDQVLFFVYAFCWNNEYILSNVNRIWVLRIYKKLRTCSNKLKDFAKRKLATEC